ncbi:hypothetical protein [Frigoriglobus tundricola]|uniref:Lipoprotein n=1 Tax=Frigoriglobus tundricola TaxID=2774151 RepID=A0A6M5YLB9_9BACT|nr:hypothetical protein [Frigoriglobus tundricola]QJW94083.1 hypothetical protein FTUN_1602 [Frigoriglobus tundricola]
MTLIRRVPPIVPLALLAGLALVPAGCGGGDGVKSYDVPKTSESGKRDAGSSAPAQPATGGDYRILGAMYPAVNPQWFFKFTGPADALTPFEAGFDKLLASVSLPPNGSPEFDTPEGWTRGPGRAGIVIATLRTPDKKYEVTVTSSTGGVGPNLKRWAVDQLGMPSFGEEDVAKYTKTIDAKGVKGLRVDLRGPKNPAGGMGGPMMGKK